MASSTSRPPSRANVAVDFSNGAPDARHASFRAFVVSGADVGARTSAALPLASAFAGLATKLTSQSATSSPPPGAGAAKPSAPKYAAASARGPWYTGAPSRSRSRWSNCSNTSGVGCNSATTAVPSVLRAHARSAAMMLNVTAASSPVEISSMHRTRAFVTSVSAMVTRFFSPPDTPRTKSSPMIVSMHPSRANSEVTASSLSA